MIDPEWEIDEYQQMAVDAGSAIRHVLETHNHADHVSGRCRLTSATGATGHVPAEGRDRPGVPEGHSVRVGGLELVALATPGYRPEHVASLVREDGAARVLLSGDSLLVGDVARPDLAVPAEGARALGDAATPPRARRRHRGVVRPRRRLAVRKPKRRLGDLIDDRPRAPDQPVAVARRCWRLHAELTRRIPARPPTVERVVGLNLRGAADPGQVRELDTGAHAGMLGECVCLLDLRDPDAFDTGHLDRSITLPLGGRGIASRAGWAADAGEPIVLISPSTEAGRQAADLLRAAGLSTLAGLSVADPPAWTSARRPLRTASALSPDRVMPRITSRALTLIDVHDPDPGKDVRLKDVWTGLPSIVLLEVSNESARGANDCPCRPRGSEDARFRSAEDSHCCS